MNISKKKIKILIADDHHVLRRGLISILKEIESFEIVAETGNGKETLCFLEEYAVDVVLLDIEMPVMNGHETLMTIKSKFPETKVIMFTTHHDLGYENHFIKLGADAFLAKNCDFEIICETILNVINDKFTSAINSDIKPQISDRHLQLALSDREKEVLKLMCKDYNTVKIAETLNINRHTAKHTRKQIHQKTRTSTLSELIMYAYREGLISIE